MSEHNLDQCLAQLDDETKQMETAVVTGIKKKSLNTLRQMIFNLSPVKTGFYRASFDLTVNGVSKYRRRRKKKKLTYLERKQIRYGYGEKFGGYKYMATEAQEQMEKAAERLGAVTRIEDIHSISIANNAPHVHFIEAGNSKKAPGGVFSVGRQVASMELEKLNSELR